MPEISFNESGRQIRAINDRVQGTKKAKDWDAAITALHELLDHPCAHHQVAAYEVWDDIHELHKRAGDYDAAIAARQEAVGAGYRSEPHPDADIAECLLLAGRRADADALFADLRRRTPDDVWLYNSAGFSYADVSDHRESARWFRDGIDVALRTGDPDQVIVQLLEGLEAAWTALDETPELGLNDRVEAFVEAWQPPPARVRHYWGGDPPPFQERRCEHCGYDPAILKGSVGNRDTTRFDGLSEFAPGRPTSRSPSSMMVSLAWFIPGEWEKATDTWPDLLEELPADHTAYSHWIEARMKRFARTLAGHPMRVAPMTIDGLTAFSTEGDDAGTAEARSSYAAEIARRGDAIPWPPGRNTPCWCGSGRKYKTCCGPVPMAPE